MYLLLVPSYTVVCIHPLQPIFGIYTYTVNVHLHLRMYFPFPCSSLLSKDPSLHLELFPLHPNVFALIFSLIKVWW